MSRLMAQLFKFALARVTSRIIPTRGRVESSSNTFAMIFFEMALSLRNLQNKYKSFQHIFFQQEHNLFFQQTKSELMKQILLPWGPDMGVYD